MTHRVKGIAVLSLWWLAAVGTLAIAQPAKKPAKATGAKARGDAGVAAVVVGNGGRAGAVDAEGRVVIPIEYEELGKLDRDQIRVRRDRRWGLVDPRGRELVAPRFDWLGELVDGRAIVRVGDGWGYVDERGELVGAAAYAEVRGFANGYGKVTLADGSERYVDRTGALQPEGFTPPPPAPKPAVKPGKAKDTRKDFRTPGGGVRALVAFEDGGRVGFRDDAGKTVIAPRYRRASRFAFGYARVWDDQDRCGYVDADGVEVVPPAYDECVVTHGGPTPVRRGAAWGYVDVAAGRVAVPFRYEEVAVFDLAARHGAVRRAGKWCLVDERGRELFPPTFDEEPKVFGRFGSVSSAAGHGVQKTHITRDGRILWTEVRATTSMALDRVASLSAAWERHADPAARARALPLVRDAVEYFFKLIYTTEVVRALVEAELALASDRPPARERVVAEMAVVVVPAVLDPQGAAALHLHPLLRDPAGERLTVEWALRDAAGAAVTTGRAPLGDAVSTVPVDLAGVPDGSYALALRVLDGDAVLRAWEVPTSVIAGLHGRLVAARERLVAATGMPDVEAATVAARWEAVNEAAAGGGAQPLGAPAAFRTLTEVEEALRRWDAGERWWREAPGDHDVAAWYRGQRVPMRLHVPSRRAPHAPLVIALHGDGVDRHWWFAQYGDGALIREAERRGWYVLAIDTHAEHAVPAALWAAQRLIRYDPDRVYLVGQSRGGLVALQAFAASPALFAGVVALAPGPQAAPAIATDAPIFVARGEHEVSWIVRSTDGTRDALAAAGAPRLAYRVYPGIEHLLIVREALEDGLDHVAGSATQVTASGGDHAR